MDGWSIIPRIKVMHGLSSGWHVCCVSHLRLVVKMVA